MFCGNCGKRILDTSRFCIHCGCAVTPEQPQQQNVHRTEFPGAAASAGRSAVHTAGRAKIYAMLSALVVLVLILVIMLYNLFLKSGKPEDTIADLEKALNKLDTEAMLDCFDKQTQQLYSGSLGLAGSLSGVDLEAVSDLASGLGGLMAGSDFLPKFTLEVIDVSYSGNDVCVATVRMDISYGGETESETQQLPMKKEGRKWLISVSALGDLESLESIF